MCRRTSCPGRWRWRRRCDDRFPSLLNSLLITTEEAAGGLVASIVVGVAVAMVFAQWRWLRQLLYPYTILLQTVPIVAIAPLIINWVGAGIPAVMVVTFIICLAPIIANTTQGLISVDENLVHLFMMHKATPAQVLFKLRLPNALPNFFTGIRISAGISVIGGNHRRAVCRFDTRGRGRPWLCDYLCEQPDGDERTCLRWCLRRRCWDSVSFLS